jgi:hypothetical protein
MMIFIYTYLKVKKKKKILRKGKREKERYIQGI